MNPTQQSWYCQVPGAYPIDEDDGEEEDPYLQMMNDIAEEEFNFGLRQSQHSPTSGVSGHQHQYASHGMQTPRSSYQISAFSRPEYAPQVSSARWPGYQKPADRYHPYSRPYEPTMRSNHRTSAHESHQTMQTRPVRHDRSAPMSCSSAHSQAYLGNEMLSAQQYYSMGNEGYTRPDPSAYEMYNLDFAGYHPMTAAPIGLEQHGIQSPQEEAEEPKKSNGKGASQAQEPIEEKKPAKPRTKCQTRTKHGRLECRIDYGERRRRWEPAVRMDDCRRALIDQQNDRAAQLGKEYLDPDPVGTGVDDETAFKEEHAEWGPDREHLPEICWRFKEDEEHHPRPSNNPGYMRFQGMVVLDPNDDPVKAWPQLPLTLSSKVRGYRLEAMSRENPHLEYRDFLARMPSVIEKPKKGDNGNIETVLEAPDSNAVCNMRMLRFRREKGMLSWTQKGNTKVIGEGLEKLFGTKLTGNSMRSFGRNLTPQEQAEIKKGKNAHFPGTERTTTPTSATTTAKKNNGIAKIPKQPGHIERQSATHRKRAREEDDDEDFDSADNQSLGQATAASYRKRRRNARGEAAKPEPNLDNSYYDPVASVNPQDLTKDPSSPTSEASGDPSDEYRDDSDSEDDDSDGEYETSTPHRQIHPLPARRTRTEGQEAANKPLPDPTHTQDQSSSSSSNENAESQPNNETTPDEDDNDNANDNNMTVEDDISDSASDSEAPQPSIQDDDHHHHQEQPLVAAASNEEEKGPPTSPLVVRQETDLDRHRRKTREFLGEQEDYYFLPEAPPPWMSTLLFPPRVPE